MLNALIVGAGKIAADFDSPEDAHILTHAHAYTKSPKFNLLGFYDINFQQAQKMAEKWKCGAFKELSDLPPKIDVISICTPDESHISDCLLFARFQPKVIFLEKPLGQSKSCTAKLQKIQPAVLVNYTRRFSKDFQNLHRQIKENKFGNYLTGTGYYGKGTIHNGSHMIDLINWLISPVRSFEILHEINDCYVNDTTKTIRLTLENNAVFNMQGISCQAFTIFELDLFFEQARIKITNSGQCIEIYTIKNNKTYSGYKNLFLEQTIQTDISSALINALDNIAEFIHNNKKLLCTAEDGKKAILYE